MLARMNRRRLDAEGVRDAMLAVSGELNPRAGGPGVLAPLEKEVKDLIFTEAEVVDLWPEDRDPAEHLRRSLYLFRKRNVPLPAVRRVRRARHPDRLPAPRDEHPRAPGACAAQQRVRRRHEPGPWPTRIVRGNGDRRPDSPRLPDRAGPRADEADRDRPLPVVPEDAGRQPRSVGRRERRIRLRPPGPTWPWRCSIATNSSMCRERTTSAMELPTYRPADAPARSRSCPAAGASSSRSPAAVSACSAWPICWHETPGPDRRPVRWRPEPGIFPPRPSAASSCS